MNSTCKFAKYFYKHLNEDNAGGALGGGAGVSREAGQIDSSDWYAKGDARVPKVLGKKKKVQRRTFPGAAVESEERRKKKKKKKNWMKGAVKKPGALNAAAEREGKSKTEYCAKPPSKKAKKRCTLWRTFNKYRPEDEEVKGLDTSWEDGDLKVTIKEVLKYLDDNDVPVKEVSTDKLKSILIANGRDPDRIEAANLEHAVIVVVDKNGKYKSILDGNHRVDKAISSDIPTVKVRELDLREAPEEYKALFNYSIEKEYE